MVLGAPSAGADELRQQLREALHPHPEFTVVDDVLPRSTHQLALLMGLDLPVPDAATASVRQDADAQMRQLLAASGLPFQVVYGQGPARLTQALHALGLPVPEEASQTRTQAQFDLNRGRTPWLCEKCSDPACEHQLFTRLLDQTAT